MKFKHLSFLFFLPLLAVPFFTTSCSHADTKLIQFDSNVLKNNKDYSTFPSISSSLTSLVYGNTQISDGNYVLIVGSEIPELYGTPVSEGIKTFLFTSNTGEFIKPEIEDSLNEAQDSFAVPSDSTTPNIKVITYFEKDTTVSDRKYDNAGDEIPTGQKFSPWEKWTTYDQTKDHPNDDSWKDKHSPDDYCRTDDNAKDFRNTVNKLAKVFGDDCFNSDKTFGVLSWCNGSSSNTTKLTNPTDSFVNYLKSNFENINED